MNPWPRPHHSSLNILLKMMAVMMMMEIILQLGLLKRSLAILKSCSWTVGWLPMNIPSTCSASSSFSFHHHHHEHLATETLTRAIIISATLFLLDSFDHLVCFPVLHHRLRALEPLTNDRETTKARRKVWWPPEQRKGSIRWGKQWAWKKLDSRYMTHYMHRDEHLVETQKRIAASRTRPHVNGSIPLSKINIISFLFSSDPHLSLRQLSAQLTWSVRPISATSGLSCAAGAQFMFVID